MLETLLIELGAPILARVIGQKFGAGAQDIAQAGIDVLAERLGVEPNRAAVETAISGAGPDVPLKVREAEERMPEILLAQAEKMRAGNEQQKLTNQLLLAKDGPLWTWAWLYIWQYVLMFFWAWTLIGVHLTGAMLRLAGSETVLPAPAVPDLLTLTTLYLGLHMGGHTVLEMVRNRFGRGDA